MQTKENNTLSIAQNAAHLLAALLSENKGIDVSALSRDAQDDIAILRAQLDAGGRLDIW